MAVLCILCYFLYAIGGLAVLAGIVKVYWKLSSGICRSRRKIEGQVAIVTGSNGGIGYETAKNLAARGAKVILACRNVETAQEAAEKIKRDTGSDKVLAMQLDVSSLQSIRDFCKQFMKQESRLDILVNNAGIAGMKRTTTSEGLELHMMTNHLGPFLLTNILLRMMEKTGTGRIVNVSSVAHTWTKDLDVENLNSEKKYEPKLLYARTKLCQILFTVELARKLEAAGYGGILVNAVNPGGVRTAIFRHARKWFKYMIMASQFFFKNPWEGAQPSIHAAVSEEVEGISGKYWEDCKLSKPSALAKDAELAKKVWDRTAELVKLTPAETIF